MTYTPVRAKPFKTYKEAQEAYDRAKKIAEHIRGDRLTPGELAALHEGFMANLRKQGDRDMDGWQTEWELLAEAARAAMDGKDVDEYGIVRKVKKGHTLD